MKEVRMHQSKYLEIRDQLNFNQSKWNLLKHMLEDTFLVSISYFLFNSNSIFLYLPAYLLLATLFFRSFAIMHDAVHFAVLKNRKINDFIGYFYSTISFLPFYVWRDVHLQHHKWSGNVDKDPSMQIVKEFDKTKVTKNKIMSLIWKSWFPILGIMQYLVFWSNIIQKTPTGKKINYNAVFQMFVMLSVILIFSIYFGTLNFLISLFLYFVLIEIINFPHHLGLDYKYLSDKSVQYNNQHTTARSCHYPKWLSSFILNNFNYHIEHHMFPTLPWYELANARKIIKPILLEKYTEIKGDSWILWARKKDLNQVLFENIT